MFKISALGNKKNLSNLSRGGIKSSSGAATVVALIKEADSPLIEAHLAFAASKKQFAKAVDRNRVKRRYRAALRNILAKNYPSYRPSLLYLMIIPRKPALSLSFTELSLKLEQSLTNAYDVSNKKNL